MPQGDVVILERETHLEIKVYEEDSEQIFYRRYARWPTLSIFACLGAKRSQVHRRNVRPVILQRAHLACARGVQ